MPRSKYACLCLVPMLTSQPPSDGTGRRVQQVINSGATPFSQDSIEGDCSNQLPHLRCFPPELTTCQTVGGRGDTQTLQFPGGDSLKHTETRSFYKKKRTSPRQAGGGVGVHDPSYSEAGGGGAGDAISRPQWATEVSSQAAQAT